MSRANARTSGLVISRGRKFRGSLLQGGSAEGEPNEAVGFRWVGPRAARLSLRGGEARQAEAEQGHHHGSTAQQQHTANGGPHRYCHPGTPDMSGSRCAMPLWQSMQVRSLVNRNRS